MQRKPSDLESSERVTGLIGELESELAEKATERELLLRKLVEDTLEFAGVYCMTQPFFLNETLDRMAGRQGKIFVTGRLTPSTPGTPRLSGAYWYKDFQLTTVFGEGGYGFELTLDYNFLSELERRAVAGK